MPWVTHWGEDSWSWNVDLDDDDGDGGGGVERDGMPGRALVAGAIALWGSAGSPVSPAIIASVFNLPLVLAEDVMPSGRFAPCDLAEALQVWSLLCAGDSSVETACVVFGRSPRAVLDAVETHPWMYVESRAGSLCIGHEGE